MSGWSKTKCPTPFWGHLSASATLGPNVPRQHGVLHPCHLLTSLLFLWNLFSPQTGKLLLLFLPTSSLLRVILKSFLTFPPSTIWIRCCSSALMVPSGTFCSSSYHSALWYSEHLSASPIECRDAAISVGISNTITHLLMPRSTLKMKSFIDSKRLGFQVYTRTL